MQTQLNGQVAIVTGGGKGYGAGIAERLRDAGAKVWITGRDELALEATASKLGVTAVVADATKPEDWDAVLASVLGSDGRLDILVNNAGGGVKIADTADQTDASIETSLALNLTSAIYGCRRAAPILMRQKSGTIINISSVCSRYCWPGWGIYSAAKAGLDAFSKSLYLELRPHGVRVSTVIPSWGTTDFTDAAGLDPRPADVLAQCTKPTELGDLIVQIATLPAHLCQHETLLLPMVQEISPM